MNGTFVKSVLGVLRFRLALRFWINFLGQASGLLAERLIGEAYASLPVPGSEDDGDRDGTEAACGASAVAGREAAPMLGAVEGAFDAVVLGESCFFWHRQFPRRIKIPLRELFLPHATAVTGVGTLAVDFVRCNTST